MPEPCHAALVVATWKRLAPLSSTELQERRRKRSERRKAMETGMKHRATEARSGRKSRDRRKPWKQKVFLCASVVRLPFARLPKAHRTSAYQCRGPLRIAVVQQRSAAAASSLDSNRWARPRGHGPINTRTNRSPRSPAFPGFNRTTTRVEASVCGVSWILSTRAPAGCHSRRSAEISM